MALPREGPGLSPSWTRAPRGGGGPPLSKTGARSRCARSGTKPPDERGVGEQIGDQGRGDDPPNLQRGWAHVSVAKRFFPTRRPTPMADSALHLTEANFDTEVGKHAEVL